MIIGCTSEWKEFERSCYKFFTSRLPEKWVKARDFCLDQNSHLVSLLSTEEQEFVTTMTSSSSYNVWIGAKLGTFDFEWEDGNEFDYTNWMSGYPSYSGDCIAMSVNNGMQWFDTSCSDNQYYICKQSFEL